MEDTLNNRTENESQIKYVQWSLIPSEHTGYSC